MQRSELVAASARCAQQGTVAFQQVASALALATTALQAQPSVQTLEAARQAYRQAMDTWQVQDTLQFGPTASSLQPGGQDFRDQLYSWPLVSRCAIEEQLVSKSYERGVGSLLVNRRGLAALEVLLFREGSDTACPPSSPIVSSGSWAALSADERNARRRAYAAAAAADLEAQGKALVVAWEGFLGTITSAGPSNSVYRSPQAALNSISDAMLHAEKDVKDTKLARPIGLRDCEAAPCVALVESPDARLSKVNIRANLVGLRKLLEGCGPDFTGPGFDDLLLAQNEGALASTLQQRTAAAATALEAIEEADLEAALLADPASVRALYDAWKAVTDLLKTQFLSVLDLELPASLEGDND